MYSLTCIKALVKYWIKVPYNHYNNCNNHTTTIAAQPQPLYQLRLQWQWHPLVTWQPLWTQALFAFGDDIDDRQQGQGRAGSISIYVHTSIRILKWNGNAIVITDAPHLWASLWDEIYGQGSGSSSVWTGFTTSSAQSELWIGLTVVLPWCHIPCRLWFRLLFPFSYLPHCFIPTPDVSWPPTYGHSFLFSFLCFSLCPTFICLMLYYYDAILGSLSDGFFSPLEVWAGGCTRAYHTLPQTCLKQVYQIFGHP